ncbi:zinc ribbon domain-containing protein [Comamonadaceae bacterium G21597-S1]|nr:zinc ribbon domain-containing protein [Comamonadaceae bacterium G21597-S1]
MPLYDYNCEKCGGFRRFRPMSESGDAQTCPICAAPSRRSLTAPYLAGGDLLGLASGGGRPGARGSWRTACGFGCAHPGCG